MKIIIKPLISLIGENIIIKFIVANNPTSFQITSKFIITHYDLCHKIHRVIFYNSIGSY